MFPRQDMTLAEQKERAIQLMQKDRDATRKYL